MPLLFNLEQEQKEIQLLVEQSGYKLFVPQLEKCKEKINALLTTLMTAPSNEVASEVSQCCGELNQVTYAINQLTRNDPRELMDFLLSSPVCEDPDSNFVIVVPDGKNGHVVEGLRSYYYRKIAERFACQPNSKDVEEEPFDIQRCEDRSILLISNGNESHRFNFPDKLIPIAKLLGVWVQNKKKIKNSREEVKILTDVRIRFNFDGPVFEIAYLENGVEKRFVDEGGVIIDNFSLKTYQLFALIGDSNLLDLDPNNEHFLNLKSYFDTQDRISQKAREAYLATRKESTLAPIEEDAESRQLKNKEN
mgnify:FL=1